MAAKKGFEGIQTNRASGVYNTIEQATSRKGQQGTAGAEEQRERMENLRTSGRKGCRAIRINMAFTPSNHEFIRVMAKATGRTMTEFCNLILEAYQNEHPEIMAQARVFLDTVNSGAFSKLAEQQAAAAAAEDAETTSEEYADNE